METNQYAYAFPGSQINNDIGITVVVSANLSVMPVPYWFKPLLILWNVPTYISVLRIDIYLYWPIGSILEILTVKELEVPTYLLDSDVFN